MITIDPCNLDAHTQPLLSQLIMSSKSIDLAAGMHSLPQETRVILKYPLLIVKKTDNGFHAEVLHDLIEQGAFGSVINSLGKVTGDRDTVQFKKRAPEKQQVVKRIHLSTMSRKAIANESIRTQLGNESLHCKSPLFSGQFGFLRMRKAGEMDFLTLQERLYKGLIKFSLLDYLEITKAIVVAVQKLHQKGRIHRDIKRENIVVRLSPMHAELIDFSFSCSVLKQKGKAIKGTVAVLPPEMFMTFEISQAGDICSLGLTLADLWGDYSMSHINAYQPGNEQKYYQHRQKQMLQLYKHINIDIPDKIATPLSLMLHGMICFDPKKRISLESALQTLDGLIAIATCKEAELPFRLNDSDSNVAEASLQLSTG